MISPGALVVSITGGQLPQDLITRSRVIVSWKEEVLAGEAPRQPYAAMIAAGTWSGDKIAGELGAVMLGKVPASQDPGETVVFECVGIRAGHHRNGLGLSVGERKQNWHIILPRLMRI